MSENNTWDNIDRRAFMKISAATVAGTVGLAKLGMAGIESRQDAVEPFSIHVPDAVLDDLRGRLARTRYPDQLENASWDYGTELSYLKELVNYWRSEFDWRATCGKHSFSHCFGDDVQVSVARHRLVLRIDDCDERLVQLLGQYAHRVVECPVSGSLQALCRCVTPHETPPLNATVLVRKWLWIL